MLALPIQKCYFSTDSFVRSVQRVGCTLDGHRLARVPSLLMYGGAHPSGAVAADAGEIDAVPIAFCVGQVGPEVCAAPASITTGNEA